MKTEIKSKVESLMNAYKEDKQGYKNKIAEWERDNLYSLDFKAEKIKALEQEAEQNDLKIGRASCRERV